MRYWDGAQWVGESQPMATPAAKSAGSRAWRPTLITWIIAAVALLTAIIAAATNGFAGFLVMLGLFALAGGVWTLATRKPGWLNLAGRRVAAVAVTGGAVVALLLGALVAPSQAKPGPDIAVGVSSSATPSATAAPSAKPSKTPTPKPTPVTKTETVEVSEPVPFASTSYEDASVDAGSTVLVTAGVAGTKVSVFKVTTVDGVETSRTLVSETVTVAPVDEVTAIGTRQPEPVAPPAAAEPEPVAQGGGCDPNYSGCVPIASDVDCAGGSGNGPAYVSGPIEVIGTDIYDLDRDGDGIACE
ncbi:hypothetical protein GCM10010988_18300 [Cnuibacter physcomitrellae]|nr:hypothetical protein GCM10010988_18300 [Cnuibacter physcomitrellae]